MEAIAGVPRAVMLYPDGRNMVSGDVMAGFGVEYAPASCDARSVEDGPKGVVKPSNRGRGRGRAAPPCIVLRRADYGRLDAVTVLPGAGEVRGDEDMREDWEVGPA